MDACGHFYLHHASQFSMRILDNVLIYLDGLCDDANGEAGVMVPRWSSSGISNYAIQLDLC